MMFEVILALRTYAMWKRSRIILTVLVVVNLVRRPLRFRVFAGDVRCKGMHIPDAWITHTSVNALKCRHKQSIQH